MNSLDMLVERKQEMRRANLSQHVKQRIAQAAQELNRAGDLAARVECANEALCRLTRLLYQADSDGVPANIDPVTYRILLPLPWGSAGWKRWGMRNHEARVLRAILLAKQRSYKAGARSPLFVYHADTRCWYLNVGDYPSHDAAQHWLQRSQVTLEVYRRVRTGYTRGVQGV